jgi:hypothetical protein
VVSNVVLKTIRHLTGHLARAGALNYANRTVADVMTKAPDVFMLDISRKLDFNTMRDIYKKGYTRIPVYEHSRDFIKGVLNVKDLILVNGDDEISLAAIIAFRYECETSFFICRAFLFFSPGVCVCSQANAAMSSKWADVVKHQCMAILITARSFRSEPNSSECNVQKSGR